jgi:hypothetical protein
VLQGALKYTRLQVPNFKTTLAENENISDIKIKNKIVSTKQQLTTYEFSVSRMLSIQFVHSSRDRSLTAFCRIQDSRLKKKNFLVKAKESAAKYMIRIQNSSPKENKRTPRE